MTQERVSHRGLRNELAWPFMIWLLACLFMMVTNAGAIRAGAFPDPDDVMRLMQVRDWLGGQSWFDVTQHRLNGTLGVTMHWSRLVDIPIATVIFLARPLLGNSNAETLALIVVPLLTLGVTMLLVHRIAVKLMTNRAALAAVAATPFSLGAMKQLRPMRIDHHGWQIVMALVGLLACFDERPRRGGLSAGAAIAVWLNVSLEGLPFAAALGGLFAFQWVRGQCDPERLRAYVGALAVATFLLFTGTHLPSTWMHQQHDVVTAAYVAGFSVAWLSIVAATAVRTERSAARLVALALAGLVTVAVMFSVDPQWMHGPFSSMDPLVRTFWYEGVDEGLPMWKVHWSEGAMGLAQPIVGLLGAIAAFTRTREPLRDRWAIYIFIVATTALSSIAVLRVATTASVLAMPGTAFLCQLAFRRARAQSLEVARVFSTTGALLLMTPAYALPIGISSPNPKLEKAVVAGMECEKTEQVSRLAALGTSEIAVPFDVAPAILLHTNVRALATGHHRNIEGMRDTIRIFMDNPEIGAPIVKSRNIDYLVICPGAPESIRYTRFGPDGLAARLIAGRSPDWLERTQIPGLHTFTVWRVRKELLSKLPA